MVSQSRWIRHIEAVAVGACKVPMWGAIPSFPWETFAEGVRSVLALPELTLTGGEGEWKQGEELLEGMGRSPLQLAIEMSPLKGAVFLLFPVEDFAKLSTWTICPLGEEGGFSDPHLQKGFLQYLGLVGVAVLDKLQVYKGLTPKIVDSPLVKEEAYCIDVAVRRGEEQIWGRIVCQPLFWHSLRRQFMRDWDFTIPSPLYQKLVVDLSLLAGSTTLSQQEWGQLQEGDLLLLDHYSYYPKNKTGSFQLTVGATPLFQVKVRDGRVKILDYAHYFEAQPMDNEHFEEMAEGADEEEPFSDEPSPIRSSAERPLLSPKQVPIALTVEVARLKMNLETLLQLKPGNVLELGIAAEKGVTLLANGEAMGRGELLQIGEVVGVKITQLGE